jgi:putative tryptophan/tyrosine transport system substrate-binding protein
MKRREFITLLGGAAAWPRMARAQQSERVRRIGVLMVSEIDDPDAKARLAGFLQGLERLGWSDRHNIRIDTRFALPGTQVQLLAKELVDLQPDVILAQATPGTVILQRTTSAIPIVFVNVADPVGSGFVASLPRPGGNLTGVLLFESSIGSKWLSMLKEMAPRLTRAALVLNPKTAPYYQFYLRAAEAAAPSVGIELVFSPIENDAAEIERSIRSFARASNGGLIIGPDTTNTLQRAQIIALAARHHLPAIYSNRLFVVDGGLMSYSTDRVDQFRQAAAYVDRILRGAKPADLPVQAPTRYETTLNLKTAKAPGLDVPDRLLVAADEVIE